MGKVFVQIVAEHDPAGRIEPLLLVWEDGRKFAIDRVLDIRQAASLKGAGRARGTHVGLPVKRFICFVMRVSGLYYPVAVAI